MCNFFVWYSTVFRGHDALRWESENGSSMVLTNVFNFLVISSTLRVDATGVLDWISKGKKVKQNAGTDNFPG
uniref:Uncharacterized protein n=1 Tax=Salix viminalis TaxID=40686 RepID=A0A6N2N4Q9_SALVM